MRPHIRTDTISAVTEDVDALLVKVVAPRFVCGTRDPIAPCRTRNSQLGRYVARALFREVCLL